MRLVPLLAAATLVGFATSAGAQVFGETQSINGEFVEAPTTPIGEQLDGGGLPGVFAGGGPARSDIARGPGGLRNGTGAIGTMAPSTSSSNPVPLVPTQLGIPLN
ncbi:hypothetical protein [Antarcticirhabdus aurantiaca]|uniref:Uncharacterized protein n=1 Tax=Antarcticirhabdus aurantiaca TaxID=2606717 RepID=A0ACD4NU59_9HYPH|nr:hypothetical protein [Antarcticirhabdus aurantiaca]WAJ30087.1 hypothetical protein OXU80_07740 [Jeongeuplla avenae]